MIFFNERERERERERESERQAGDNEKDEHETQTKEKKEERGEKATHTKRTKEKKKIEKKNCVRKSGEEDYCLYFFSCRPPVPYAAVEVTVLHRTATRAVRPHHYSSTCH